MELKYDRSSAQFNITIFERLCYICVMKVVIAFVGDIRTYVPYGAVTISDGTVKRWHGPLTEPMPASVADELVSFLETEIDSGSTVVSFNGAGFGFRSLATVATSSLERIVLEHVDIMAAFVAGNAYMTSLDSFMSVLSPGTANSVPPSWAVDPEGALRACENTARSIATVHVSGEKRGLLMRKSKSGKILPWYIRSELELPPSHICTVSAALAMKEPAPSWLSSPTSAQSLVSWMYSDKPSVTKQKSSGDISSFF